MLRPEDQSPEDEQIQCALEQGDAFILHSCCHSTQAYCRSCRMSTQDRLPSARSPRTDCLLPQVGVNVRETAISESDPAGGVSVAASRANRREGHLNEAFPATTGRSAADW